MSGHIGVAPDGTALEGFEAQCAQAVSNVEASLASSNMTVSDVLRVTYYLTNTGDLPALSALRKAL